MNTEMTETLERSESAAARAGGSSFYFAMRILPRAQREAMFEVYSFCKRVDDIADSDTPRSSRLQRLADWRRNMDALYSGRVPAGLEALAHAIARFSLQKEDFLAVIEGMEMDSAEDIRAPISRGSISTATALPVPSDGCPFAFLEWTKTTAKCLRTISAVRCN
jgi:phytoene synthase